MSPRRSLTTKVLPSRMLIRRGCTSHPSADPAIFPLHVRPVKAFIRPIPWVLLRQEPAEAEGSTVVETPQEPPSRIHQRLRVAMVAPPWYELPPVGYGGLEVITAALVDALVERGHEV